jgi:hypothetical protein
MYTPLEYLQLRQYIDAEQARSSLLQAEAPAFNYRGGMAFRTVKGREYLIRSYSSSHQKSLGPRSAETTKICDDFIAGKQRAAQILSELQSTNEQHVRMNQALRIGRAPSLMIEILERLRVAGLAKNLLVIGTKALFAYEAHAGVRFGSGITATEDDDLLWDSRKSLDLVSDTTFNEKGLLGVIRKADATFELMEEGYRAVNSKGYMVYLIKRRKKSLFDEKEPQQMIKYEQDFWAVKAHSMEWLLSAPKFKQTIVGANGQMVQMVTIDPRAFVLHKTWLSQKADRSAIKKPRDTAQAGAVFELIEDRFPQLTFESIHVFPESVRQLLAGQRFLSK